VLTVSVAFVGFTRPGTGGVPACAEMVARYFALLCSGTRTLPTDWKQRAATDAAMEEGLLHLSAGRLRSLIMYGEFMESMAMHIGCAPRLPWLLLTKPRLWLHMMHGPMVGAQFRLRGPGACPEHAEKVIIGGPIPTPLPFRLAQGVSAVLGWIGGSVAGFRPTSW
jgi:dimethylaniline monooxygenase (N-oxide forming)